MDPSAAQATKCAVEADLIYDVGAHLGEDSDFYLKLGFRVVAIEANPILAARLRERFSHEIAAGRFVLIEGAVASAPGEVDFFVNSKDSVWGTTEASWAERNRRLGAPSSRIRVPTVAFAEVLRQHGIPHYLKIDIEGADALCTHALSGFAECPEYISLETDESDPTWFPNQLATLENLGYHRFRLIRQGAHRPGSFRTRSGETMAYRFDEDASGAFGRNLGGGWLTRRQAIRKYRAIRLAYLFLAGHRFPGRFIKKIPRLRRAVSSLGWYDLHAAR